MAGKMTPSRELMLRMRQAFLDYGYDGTSMVTLAKAGGFTRRSLYNYFSNKEEVFRATIRFDNRDFIATGLAAGEEARRKDGSALDIITATLDTRYGIPRRLLSRSPHVLELNAETYRHGRDIMIETALEFQAELERLLGELQRQGLLKLNRVASAKQLAQILADSGRALSQALPPIPNDDFTARYRAMCAAVLYGSATESAGRKKRIS